MMSDVKNVDIILGSDSRDDERNDQSENELNLDSGSSRPHQSSNLVGEDFRSLLNTNSKKNSEVAIETTKMISDEIANQVTRKFNDIRSSLNLQIQEAIITAITEKVLPSIQNTLNTQGRGFSPSWTECPVCYNGDPKFKLPGKHGKIVPKRVLHGKIVDECLASVQSIPILANKIATTHHIFLQFLVVSTGKTIQPNTCKGLVYQICKLSDFLRLDI